MFGKKTRLKLEELEKKIDICNLYLYEQNSRIFEGMQYLEKFYDHLMKFNGNVDRIDKFQENFSRFVTMFNEFKGHVSIMRANLMRMESNDLKNKPDKTYYRDEVTKEYPPLESCIKE
jgi:hypothetical protein